MIKRNNHECSYILIKPKVYLRYYMGVTAAIQIKKHLMLDIAWVQQQQQKRKHPIIRTSRTINSQVILRLSLFIFVFYPYVRPSSEKNIFHCESMLWNFYNCISTITIALFIFKFLTTNTTDLHKVNVLPCSFCFRNWNYVWIKTLLYCKQYKRNTNVWSYKGCFQSKTNL